MEAYDGCSLKWFHFVDLFRTLVHETDISPGEKLAVLRRSLKGEALEVVYGLSGGEEAYKEALVGLIELQAFGLLGARLADKVCACLRRKIEKIWFWTDSSCVRNWTKSPAAYYKPYVSVRIGEIQTRCKPEEWRFIPGKINVSDLATRSSMEIETRIPEEWFRGQQFLREDQENWPQDIPWIAVLEDIRGNKTSQISHATGTERERIEWEKVEVSPNKIIEKEITRTCQEEMFEEELKCLRKDKQLKGNSKLLPLHPILDNEGIIREGGRLRHAQLPYDQLHPTILPTKHPLTDKMVMAYHQHCLHVGTELVLAQIRQRYWIVKGREVVKKASKLCPTCLKEKTRPATQLMADLPRERLAVQKEPFHHTAVDYFVPLEVSQTRNRITKRYGALFTCLTTRAVYLDRAETLTTQDFLNILRRFIGIYGKPCTRNSDNGTNFVGAEKELVKSMKDLEKDSRLENWIKEKGIIWKFQPPSASHFGGAHESLVRSTKRALYRALEMEKAGLRYPTEDMLRTVLYEVAGLLNSRPLTYVSSDKEHPRPITPNDFLNRPPTTVIHENIHTKESLPSERVKYVQKITNLFWDMWVKQYLPTLTKRRKWQGKKQNLEVGDGVMIVDPNQPRGQWKIGRVVDTFPSYDQLVRVVNVKNQGWNL